MGIWQGFLFGLMLQLSVGPVFFALVQRAIAQGMREGLKMALGVAAMDALYMAASGLGVSALLQIPLIRTLVMWSGALLLLWFGFKALRSEGAAASQSPAERGGNSFGYGFLLTLGNPLTILFWSAVYGSLLASGRLQGAAELLSYSLGCVLATVVFLGATAMLATGIRGWIGPRTTIWLNRFVGIVLIGFALTMLIKSGLTQAKVPFF